MPLLSIIIPVYNSEKTIGRSLESLNKMFYESKKLAEVVVVDDGSTDKSMEIVTTKKNALSPLSIDIITQENKGTGAARNFGLKKCKGIWIFFLDADDELAFDPIPYLKKSPDASSLGFSVQYYKGSKYKKSKLPVFINLKNHLDVLTAQNAFTASSIIFKKDLIQSPFDAAFLYLEDWSFWIMNPLIFEKMKIFSSETSAIIHAQGGNKSTNYIMGGKYRKIVADKILTNLGGRLTHKQKNNLLIQSQIGMIMQEKKIPLKTFLLFPCDAVLYSKLVIFFILRKKFAKLDIYGDY